MWRALSYCLPTVIMLSQKRVSVVHSCLVCNAGDETILHALASCPFAAQCWYQFLPGVQQNKNASFKGWLENIFDNNNSEKCAMVVMICWTIWKAHNEKHWNRKQWSINIVLTSAKQYLVQWQNSRGRSSQALCHSRFVGDGAASWVKPKLDSIKVNVDAAVFRDQTEYGMGMMALDHRGYLMLSRSLLRHESASLVFAEAMASYERGAKLGQV